MVRSYFAGHRSDVRVEWRDSRGLRTGQLGAVWAIASHFTASREPVQAVLPTGVGKTAVMTLLPFLVPTSRILVITPGRLVRDQVVEEFITLRDLKSAGVCDRTMAAPRVRRAEHRVSNWSEFEDCDVVVGTPQVVSSAYQDVAPIPDGLFDLALVDEAHHAAAPTWSAVLTELHDVRRVLLTATPFRRDRLGLPGDIIYRYPLRLAIDEHVYQPITFYPVHVPADRDRDEVLVEQAFDRLTDPLHMAAGSAVLVRTDRVAEAERLVAVYASAGVSLGLVTARTSMRDVKRLVNDVEGGLRQGVVSVGVLGEGFDLPKLKIAVYHERHKSLPATLQFVGRIARMLPDGSRPPAELLAVRSDVQDETRELYAQDASWGELVPTLVDAAIDKERARRNYAKSIRVQVGGELSVHAIEPVLQAEVFRLPSDTTSLSFTSDLLLGSAVEEVFIDESAELMAIVTRRALHPDWLRSAVRGWDSDVWELHLVVLDRKHALAFISTTSEATLAALAVELGWSYPLRVEPEAMNRLLHRLEVLSYSSVGMRSLRAPSHYHASYQTVAGTTVNLAVSASDARAFGVGHLIGRHRDEQGLIHAIGISVRKRKVWASEHVDLLQYKQWCLNVGALMAATGAVGVTAPLLPLAMPSRLTRFPNDPVALVLSYKLLQGDTFLVPPMGDPVDIAGTDIVPARIDGSRCSLTAFYGGAVLWAGAIDTSGKVSTVGAPVDVRVTDGHIDLAELLTDVGVTLYFVDGSSTEGGSIFRPTGEMPPVPRECIWQLDWSTVDIRRESKPGRDGRQNVQERSLDWLRSHTGITVVINDDSANEIADLVALDVTGDDPVVHLAHCKWSSQNSPGHRLEDVHDVVCQAIRSARWAGARAFYPELLRRLERGGSSSVVVGNDVEVTENIRRLAEARRPPRIRVYVFQPGLRMAGVETHATINTLLVNAAEWIRAQGSDLVIVGS